MSSDLALRIASKDEIKVYKKKIQMLKQAVKGQRKNNQTLHKTISDQKQKNWKVQNQLKKKEEKNEILLVEIRQLKDALVVERNQKLKLMEQLEGYKRAQSIVQGVNTPGQQSSLGSYLSFWK